MSMDLVPIRRALLSVHDKSGLDRLGKALAERNVEILSSGGTAKYLAERKIPVREVSDYTGAPEMLDGRLKTLHPKIHGGILAVRTDEAHMKQLKQQGYLPIDLVVVNLYPFEETVRREGVSREDVIEQIDIGGPTLLRAAAKNHAFVTVLTDPSQYDALLEQLESQGGATTREFREQAARRVFERTASYDVAIAGYFQGAPEQAPGRYLLALEEKWPTRYGENPHQHAAFYLPAAAQGRSVLDRVLQGKQLSYNNLLDVHAALDLIGDLPPPFAAAILKHTNPCGVGVSAVSLLEAYERALACDPVSAFGGIVVFSRPVDKATAEACTKTFTEIVIAPKFEPGALEVFRTKKNLRLLEVDPAEARRGLGGFDIRRAADGYLIQQRDRQTDDLRAARVVTRRPPTEGEMRALTLAWVVAKHVKSNAIVLADENRTLGIGAGQMSRVDSGKLAAWKADPKTLKGAVLASDAFFPFRDSIEEAARHGIAAVVQPGGSVRDEEVIAAADEYGMAMLFTGVRHFRH